MYHPPRYRKIIVLNFFKLDGGAKITMLFSSSKILFLTQENKFISLSHHEKARNDVITCILFTSEDMENTPLGFRMWFCMNFTSDVFPSKTPVSCVYMPLIWAIYVCATPKGMLVFLIRFGQK